MPTGSVEPEDRRTPCKHQQHQDAPDTRLAEAETPRCACGTKRIGEENAQGSGQRGRSQEPRRKGALTRRTHRDHIHIHALSRLTRRSRTKDPPLRLREERPSEEARPTAPTVRAEPQVHNPGRAVTRRPRRTADHTPAAGQQSISARRTRQHRTRATNVTHRQPAEKRRVRPACDETASQQLGRRHGPPARAATPRVAVEQGTGETTRAMSTPGRATVGRASEGDGRVGLGRANSTKI